MRLPAAGRLITRSIPGGRWPFRLADSGGGGVPRPSARHALLALALLAITLAAAVASLRPHAAAHPGHVHPTEITVAMTRLAAETRTWYDDVLARTISEPLGTTRSNDLVISGTTTLRIGFGQGVLRPLTLANFTVTNGTLSNFRDLNPPPLGVMNNITGLEIDVTPTADGPVTVSLPAGSLRGVDGRPGGHDFSHLRNVEGSITLTARLGPPKVFWAEFVSNNAQGRGGGGPYPAGAHIDLAVFFSEQVTVSGSPIVQARTPGGTVDFVFHNNSVTLLSSANTLNGSGTSMLIFRHTVPAGGYSNGRTLIASDSIILPSGASIVDADGNAARLQLPPRFETFDRLVPGEGTGLPRLGTAVGDAHTYEASFNERVFVSRESGAGPAYFPVQITTNADETAQVRAAYVSGSGTRRLTFRYAIAAADDVKLFQGFNTNLPFMRIPQGFVIQNAAGIELSLPRYEQYRTVQIGHVEGTQAQFLFGFSQQFAPGHDVTVHLVSPDTSRVSSLDPASLLFRNSSLHPSDWEGRRSVTARLPRDSDTEDNYIRLAFRLETTHTFNGFVGRWLWLRISDVWPVVSPGGTGGPSVVQPVDDNNQPPPLEPPELEDQVIIEGQSAAGEFDLGDSDRPRAAVEFLHRFRPDGAVNASPDPARFERHDWWRRQSWKLEAPHDADSDDEVIRWYLDADSDDRQWDNIYVHRAQITIRDDDPQVSALEALNQTVTEGGTAVFRVRVAKAPLSAGRTVRLTLNAAGDVLAPGLTDADPQTEGIQLDLPLEAAPNGSDMAHVYIATQDDDQDEVDGFFIIKIEQPTDHTAPNYFTLAGGAASFAAVVSVLDNDEPPPVEEVEEPVEVEEPAEEMEEEPTEEVEEPVEDPEEVEVPVEVEEPEDAPPPLVVELVEEPTEVEEPEEVDEPTEIGESEEIEPIVLFPNTGSGGLADSPATPSPLRKVAPPYPRLPWVIRRDQYKARGGLRRAHLGYTHAMTIRHTRACRGYLAALSTKLRPRLPHLRSGAPRHR